MSRDSYVKQLNLNVQLKRVKIVENEYARRTNRMQHRTARRSHEVSPQSFADSQQVL